MSSSSELRVRLVSLNMFKPSSDFFADHSKAVLLLRILFCYLCVMFVFVMLSSANCSLVITCWERVDLLALLCVVLSCVFVTFPYYIPGQVWYLILSVTTHIIALLHVGLINVVYLMACAIIRSS